MIYRKRGSTVRWENGTLVRVTESGVAIEDGDVFRCHPERGEGPPAVDATHVLTTARALQHYNFERLILTDGVAEHECGDKRWSERTRRIHASLANGALRVLIDHIDDVAPIADALARVGSERPAPARLRLAPCVTAALLPSLPGIVQTAGGVDGYGNPIVEAAGDWPNWYRPSYRMRPVRMPLNVRLECGSADIDGDLPRAIALLAPPQGNAARVLIVEGERVYPSEVRVTRIAAVGAERVWYPYAGGSFGAELML